jgi:hypothetical protein
MTRQEVFNKVATHLLTQNRKSMIGHTVGRGKCRYRTPNGLSCAVGCLIPDELYTGNIEGCDVNRIFLSFPALSEYLGEDNRRLLKALQTVHDCCDADFWAEQLVDVAYLYRLDDSVVRNFQALDK